MIQPDRQPLAAQEDVPNVPRLSTEMPDDQFRARWLAEACRSIEGVSAGCLVLAEDDEVTETLWPEGCEAATLRRAADRARAEGREVVLWTRADTAGSGGLGAVMGSLGMGIVVACPLPSRGVGAAVVALSLSPRPGLDARQIVDSLHRCGGWIEARAGLRHAAQAQARGDGLAAALDVVLTAGEDPRLRFSAAALANDLALRFGCDRVAVGIVRRGHVRVRGLSHLGTALRRSELVTTIESAMEEATDQREAIVYPPLPDRRRRLDGAHRALARATEAAGVMTVPLRAGGRVVGAISFERRGAEGFGSASLQQAEAVAALLGPTIALQARADRWLSGRVRDLSETALHALFGPAHPAAKLAAVAAGLVAAALVLVDGTHRVTAKATTEGVVQRAAAAPFDGFVLSAPARAGDTVRRGDVLAVLDDRDLLLEQARWRSELEKSRQKYHEAFSKRERPAVTAASAQIKGAQAQLDLVDEKLRRTRITAPFDGIVVSGDYSQLLGSPIEKGKTLFEIAPTSDHRVVMQVDERDLRHVAAGQTGHLVLTGVPSQPLPLAVSKITPVASVEDGRNVFRVEASLAGQGAVPLRPGMEGVAKVEVGSRSLAWIWTHGLWDWLRLAAWKWLP